MSEHPVSGQHDTREGRQPPSLEAVYDTLRGIARRERSRNPSGTINTTVLVHEAWLKLEQDRGEWNDARHCRATYAMAIRRILVDHARARAALKRTQNDDFLVFENERCHSGTAEEIMAVDHALSELERVDERLVRLVELRFFVGLTNDEASESLGVSARTAARDWKRARAFLQAILE